MGLEVCNIIFLFIDVNKKSHMGSQACNIISFPLLCEWNKTIWELMNV
jgi:hypothetical protein